MCSQSFQLGLRRKLLPVALLLFLGCGAQSGRNPESRADYPAASLDSAEAITDTETLELPLMENAQIVRKIIYETEINLEVTSIEGIPEKLKEIVKNANGYIAKSRLDGASGNRRVGTWTIKVPIEKYSDFLDRAGTLGELRSLNEKTTEVTAEFYDLQARFRTKEQEEARMLKHLEEDTKALEDILEVEKELMRIRGELERLKGQLRLLSHQTDYSTIMISIREFRDFEPELRLGFLPEVHRSFMVSLQRLIEFLRVITVSLVAIFPWALLLGLPIYLLIINFFRFKSPKSEQSQK